VKIKILGAHNTESRDTKYMCLLVDDCLAVDAGSLTSSLTFEEQTRIQSVLLTHGHYDHIRDIPALAINLYLRRRSVDIFTHQAVYDNLTEYFLNGKVYSEFHKNRLESKASLNFHIIEPLQQYTIGKYQVKAVRVKHSIATMGYQVTTEDGSSFFYSGDTGDDLSEAWAEISPRVLFIEVTSDDKWLEAGKQRGHLTPALLKQELISFHGIKGYFPRVISVHMNPADEFQIRSELKAIAADMGTSIDLAYEGMLVEI
jgi:ribonuclease BN (tRNA processing enzyme)